MNNADRKWGTKIADEAIKAIVTGPYNITGQLTFKDGERMDHTEAIKLMQAYWHKVDRIFFGRAADNGYGINRRCHLEFGKSQKCIHMHFVAHSPFDASLFCAMLNVLWETFNDANTKAKDNWIAPIQCKASTAGYVTKEAWRFRDDMACTNCNHTGTDYEGFDLGAQIQRIASRVDADLLEAAYDRVSVHCVLIRKKMEQREQQLIAKRRARDQRMASSMASLRQQLQTQ